MTKPLLDLVVRVHDTVVGRLNRERDGRVRFTLDDAWLAARQVPVLSLSLLSRPEPRVAGTGLPTWFDHLLPEVDTPLRRRICRQYGLRDNDAPGLLRLLGADLPGAVVVFGDSDEPDTDPALASNPPGAPAMRFSLAGVQLKFSVIAAGDRYVLPVRGTAGRLIAKVAGAAHPELAEVEAATMGWARACGHDVPSFSVVERETLLDVPLPDDTERLFVIERFDRPPQGRVHQEDLAQALEIDVAHKYGDSGPRKTSYDLITRFVRDAAGDDAARELVARIGFVIASGNGDAHLKNWSLRWDVADARGPSLAPCYDQVSTIAWDEYGWAHAGGATLALGFGRKHTLRDLDRVRLREFARRSGVPRAEDVLVQSLVAARHAWRAIRESAPRRMCAAIVDHWEQVPLLRWIGLQDL